MSFPYQKKKEIKNTKLQWTMNQTTHNKKWQRRCFLNALKERLGTINIKIQDRRHNLSWMPASQNIRPQFYNILINMVTNCFMVGHLVLYNPSKCQAATKVWGWRINNSIQKHKVLTTTRESNRVVRYQLLSWNIPSFCLTIQQHQVKKPFQSPPEAKAPFVKHVELILTKVN